MLSHEEIRQRARILVVDDQEFPYQALFERDGYAITKWDDVPSMSDLESRNFDLILLDLQGVGRGQSVAGEGFGVLKHLRTTQPALIIIAYSNSNWSLTHQPFFELADATLAKTADYLDFKLAVDDLLAQKFSLGFYLSRIASEVGGSSVSMRRLQKVSRDAILMNRPEKLQSFLSGAVSDDKVVDRALAIAQVAIGIVSLWVKT